MDIQEEKADFEAEFRKTDFYKMNLVNCFCFINARYVWDEVQAAWEMWQASKAKAVPKWISVDDELPSEGDLLLGISTTKLAKFNVYQVVALDEFDDCEITHWMHLPQAPKAQEQSHDSKNT